MFDVSSSRAVGFKKSFKFYFIHRCADYSYQMILWHQFF